MKWWTNRRLDAYGDGALSERQRRRFEAELETDPELEHELALKRGLGRMVREVWNEGPPAPSPEYLISMLRPAMRRVDAELAVASPWRRLERASERLGQWLRPAPVAALIGAAALLAMAVLPSNQLGVRVAADSGAVSEPRATASAPMIQSLALAATAGPTGGAVYDLGQGESPLMLLESDKATVIWVIPDDRVSSGDTEGWA